MDELCGINLSEPRIELEREIMRAVRCVLREYSKNSGNQMFNRKEKSVEKVFIDGSAGTTGLNEIQIVPMMENDYDEVQKLWMTIHGFRIRVIADSRDDIARFIRRNPSTSVIAKIQGKIVGSILCGYDGRQGSLYHVCVAKEYRRLGIGTQMVVYCMQRLSEMGVNKVTLIAFKDNDAGNAFWNQTGWTRSDVNFYEFVLNENNITHFITGDDVSD